MYVCIRVSTLCVTFARRRYKQSRAPRWRLSLSGYHSGQQVAYGAVMSFMMCHKSLSLYVSCGGSMSTLSTDFALRTGRGHY
eukprot:2521936-Amphidinium_carterae.1